MNGDDDMSTVTTKQLPDSEDDSIEAPLRRFESTLRFWSPLLLGACRKATPIGYTGAIALSTIIGYALFFLPSIVIATLAADVVTNVALFTTLTTIVGNVGLVASAVMTHAWIPAVAGLALYTLLLVNYTPDQPNGTADALFGTSEWQRLTVGLIVGSIVFVGSATYAVMTATPLAFAGTILASWWVMRRVYFITVWDDTRYIIATPLTETLVGVRIPTIVGMGAFVFGLQTIGLVLMLTPFVGGITYLLWRRTKSTDGTQENVPSVRMYEKSGLPMDMIHDFSPAGAYRANANDELFRCAINKFNSLLETEVDTTRRVSVPDGRLSYQHIESAISDAESIHTDFTEVAYRPERFDDVLEEVNLFGEQYQEVLEEEGIQ